MKMGFFEALGSLTSQSSQNNIVHSGLQTTKSVGEHTHTYTNTIYVNRNNAKPRHSATRQGAVFFCFSSIIHTLVLNLTGVRGPKKASHWVCACLWGSSGSGLTVKTSDSQHGDRGSSPVRGTFFLFTFFVPLTLFCELNVYNRWFCTCVTRSRSGLTVKTSDSQHEDRGSSSVLGLFFVPKRLRGTKNVKRRTSAPTGI